MVLCPILSAGWGQVGISLYTQHKQFPPLNPAKPDAGIPGLVEGPAPMGWPPGFIAHKIAPMVIVDGNPGVKHGHDIGYLIPHFAIPMNVLCALHTLISKHKVMFPVSSVVLQGSPAGTYLGFAVGLICASPTSLPSGAVMLFHCTVMTSPSPLDVVKGFAYIAIEIGFDRLWDKYMKTPLNSALLRAAEKAGLDVVFRLLKEANTVAGNLVCSAAGKILGDLPERLAQHILKSWVVGPTVKGLVRGSVVVGRGDVLSHKFFGPVW